MEIQQKSPGGAFSAAARRESALVGGENATPETPNSTESKLESSDVARALPTRRSVTPAQDRVARSLLMDGPATSTDLSVRLKITAAGVRRHLDALSEAGYVVAGDRPAYGPAPTRGRGRPPKIYSLTEAGRGVSDQGYDDLAVAALDFLAESVGLDAVSEFANRRAVDLERRYIPIVSAVGSAPEDRARALAGALTNDGFAATIVDEDVGAGIQICQHNCPVSHVAERYPVFCEQEAMAMQRILGANVTRLATIAHGDGVCTSIVNRSVPRSEARSDLPRQGTSAADVVSDESGIENSQGEYGANAGGTRI